MAREIRIDFQDATNQQLLTAAKYRGYDERPDFKPYFSMERLNQDARRAVITKFKDNGYHHIYDNNGFITMR